MGYGRISSEKEFSLSIPPHVKHGTKIKVSLEDIGLRDVHLHIVVLIDRQGGGQEELARHGYALHAVFTLGQILDVLVAHGEIDETRRQQVLDWLNNGS